MRVGSGVGVCALVKTHAAIQNSSRFALIIFLLSAFREI